jgi:hypothetical protein
MVMTADVTATDQQLTPTAPSAERFSVSELLNPPVGRSRVSFLRVFGLGTDGPFFVLGFCVDGDRILGILYI